MRINEAFGKALYKFRKKKQMSQEDFSLISSRTYISTLERGLKSPTLEKIDTIATAMEIHPMSLIALAYIEENEEVTITKLISDICNDLKVLRNHSSGSGS